jgi:hypothetical protein
MENLSADTPTFIGAQIIISTLIGSNNFLRSPCGPTLGIPPENNHCFCAADPRSNPGLKICVP